MFKYILKRILIIPPTMLVIVFIIYLLLDLTPGSPAEIILGQAATPELIEQLNHELGYDQTFVFRYVRYIGDLLQGDFGKGYQYNRPVVDEIFARMPITLRLSVTSMAIAVLIALPLGVLSAVKQYSLFDMTATGITLFLACVPGFWLGLMMILFFSLRLGWLPSSGTETWVHYILPAVTQALPQSAKTLRLTRTTMLETIRQDYVRTARSKGQVERKIIVKHALKNALLPVITQVGVDFGYILGGTIILERVFSINGLGNLLLNAIQVKDVPIVSACAISIVFFYSLALLAVDILYAFVDPRIKAKYSGTR